MRKGFIVSTIFISTLAFGFILSSGSVYAQTKATNRVIYKQGDQIDITVQVPGGTTLYTQAANIVIVLDRSNSMLTQPMSGTDPTPRINAAINGINRFLDLADPTKHRIALATFGTLGYWEVNFTTNYAAIRNRLTVIRAEMVTRNAGPFANWECTSHGEGVNLAVSRLVADLDTDPDFALIFGDGAENGKDQNVWAYPPFGVESRFLEQTTAIATAQTRNIRIHSIGLSTQILDDLQGVFLGFKCGKIYEPARGYPYRTGEQHLRDHISTPTGGTYARVVSSGGLNGLSAYMTGLFRVIATDYDIRVRERFSSTYFDPITGWGSARGQVQLLGNNCSGASGNNGVSPNPVPAGGVYSFWVRWNSIPQGQNRCIIIRTNIKSDAPPGEDLPVDVYPDTRIEIINRGVNVAIPQAYIDILAGAWMQTRDGDVGSIGKIDMTINPPADNASYLVITQGSIDNFRSARGWNISSYGGLTYKPPAVSHSIYNAMLNKYSGRCAPVSFSGQRSIDIANAASGGCRIVRYNALGQYIIATPGWTSGYAGNPAVVFINNDLRINHDFTIDPDSGLIFVVRGDVIVRQDVEEIAGVFIFDGSFDDSSGDERLVVHGSLIGGSLPGETFNFQRDLGADNENNPAELIMYEPKYLWLFRDIIGDKKTIFKEVAP